MRRLLRSPVLCVALLAFSGVELLEASQHTHASPDCGACRLLSLFASAELPAPAIVLAPAATPEGVSPVAPAAIEPTFSPESGRAPPAA